MGKQRSILGDKIISGRLPCLDPAVQHPHVRIPSVRIFGCQPGSARIRKSGAVEDDFEVLRQGVFTGPELPKRYSTVEQHATALLVILIRADQQGSVTRNLDMRVMRRYFQEMRNMTPPRWFIQSFYTNAFGSGIFLLCCIQEGAPMKKPLVAGLCVAGALIAYAGWDQDTARTTAARICEQAQQGMPLNDYLARIDRTDFKVILGQEQAIIVTRSGMGRHNCTITHDGTKITRAAIGLLD